MMFKKYTAALALSLISIFDCLGVTQMTIWFQDGTKVAIPLSEEPRISFNEYNMTIERDNLNIAYPLESLTQITYDEEAASIQNLNKDANVIRIAHNTIVIENKLSDFDVKIYNLRSDLVFEHKYAAGESAIVNLDTYDKGAYILTINGISHKIAIR